MIQPHSLVFYCENDPTSSEGDGKNFVKTFKSIQIKKNGGTKCNYHRELFLVSESIELSRLYSDSPESDWEQLYAQFDAFGALQA
jgi:hypothetical protein